MITKFLCLFALLTGWSVSAQTTPTNHPPFCCRFPLRLMGPGQPVNLTPLFQWWTSHAGQEKEAPAAAAANPDPYRPLRAWKRITGLKTAEPEYGWVVNAIVATSPASRTNEWIVLKHPPAAEEYRYYTLQNQLAQYDQQIANDQRLVSANAKEAEKLNARANRDAGSFSKSIRVYEDEYSQRAAQYRKAAADALADQKQNEQWRDQTRKLLDELPGAKGRYVLDCFALEIGRNSKGQLIFDAGAADGYSQ